MYITVTIVTIIYNTCTVYKIIQNNKVQYGKIR